MRSPACARRLRCRGTLGGAVRHQWRHHAGRGRSIVGAVTAAPGDHLGIHAHNDTEPGGRQFAGRGAGRGAPDPGHAQRHRRALRQCQSVSLIPTLVLKKDFAERFEIGVDAGRGWRRLTGISPALRRHGSTAPQPPGALCRRLSAFATKAGIHASAIVKDPSTYEHVPPESVGNRRRMLVSEQAGKSNLAPSSPAIGHRAVEQGRQRVSMRCCARSRSANHAAMPMTGRTPPSSFWRVACSAPCRVISTSKASGPSSSGATMRSRRARHGCRRLWSRSASMARSHVNAGEGNGPSTRSIWRFAQRSRQVLPATSSATSSWSTSRCVSSTAARARSPACWSRAVMARANRWFTVGVSPNIVDASFQALSDSIVFKLLRIARLAEVFLGGGALVGGATGDKEHRDVVLPCRVVDRAGRDNRRAPRR
jgi:2-isopropylmalate synthase